MKKQIPIYIILALSSLFYAGNLQAQCASNMGFENGNFGSWTTATDSLFIQPANRVYTSPGINMRVVNYGVTDAWLGTINRPHTTAGNRLVRIGNRGVRAVADTVYRTYIVDSLSDKLTIYSMGVSELAHDFWGVPINESPGFGYEIYVNGQKIDCLKGSFFTGNVDQPPVWQLGTFKDTSTVRKSTGWGQETLNFACFVGDTIEIRLFTRDCILLGHYAYAYFDVVCGDTSKPVLSQIQINDIIADDELDLYCVPGATLFLEPQTDVCPLFMGNIQWTPANHIVGPQTLDSAIISVTDSAWIFVEAEFSNYCMTVSIIDSIFVRKLNSDPHDNLPKINRNFCDCKPDTLDFNGIDVNTIWDNVPTTYSLSNGKLIFNPCDKFYTTAFWKNPSVQTTINGSTIGATTWSSGNNRGAIGVDSILPGGRVRYTITPTAGKVFYAGINDVNSNFNNDMDHSVFVNGTNIRAYYGTSSQANLGTFTGTITVEFVVLTNRRVRLYINGTLVHSYSSGQLANTPVFPDYSGQSNHNPHIDAAAVMGPTRNIKNFSRLQNPTPLNLFMDFVDRCGVTVQDTITFTPGFTAAISSDVVQCGLTPLFLNMNSSSLIDNLSWSSVDARGTFSQGGGAPNQNKHLDYIPHPNDYNFKPIAVIITAHSGRCTATDTGYMTINEIPSSDAGPDITTTLDSFAIGGSPAGACMTCGSFNTRWTQGNALDDSTAQNPMAYSNLIGAPYFVIRNIDPVSGCFSRDTVYVYTSLSNESSFMQTNCISTSKVEMNWIMVPDAEISQFGIDYSLDEGRTWYTITTIQASQTFDLIPQNYRVYVEKQSNQNTIYRWYAISPKGEKTRMLMLEDLECQEGNVYTFFPNPFTKEIEVQIAANNGVKNHYLVQLVNQYGQVVHEKLITFTEASLTTKFLLDGLEEMNTGIYYLNIKNNGELLYKTLVVKSP